MSLLLFGRKIILKYGKFVGITHEKMGKFEAFFNKYGEISTFNSRLIPEIPQYISMPAGLAKINIFRFCLFTALCAGAWCAILLGVGYFLGSNPDKQTLLVITIAFLAVVAVISAVYIMKQFWFQAKASHFS